MQSPSTKPGKRISHCSHALYHESLCDAATKSSLYRCYKGEEDTGIDRGAESHFYAIRNETTAGRNTKLAKRLQPESEESRAVAAALAKKLVQGEETVGADGTALQKPNSAQKEKMIVYKTVSSRLWYRKHRPLRRQPLETPFPVEISQQFHIKG